MWSFWQFVLIVEVRICLGGGVDVDIDDGDGDIETISREWRYLCRCHL